MIAFIFMIYIVVMYPCCYLENFSIGSPGIGRSGAISRAQGDRTILLNTSPPTQDCINCAISMGITLASAEGPDEVPLFGQLLAAGEIAVDAYTCSSCGVNIVELSDCMIERQDDGQELDARMCTCTEGKICQPGMFYQGMFNLSEDVNSDTPPAPPPPSAEDVESAESALALATANQNSGEMIHFRIDTPENNNVPPPTPPTPPSIKSGNSHDRRNADLTNRCSPNDNGECPFICPEARGTCCGGSHAETTNSCNLCVIQNCRNNPEWFTTITEVPEDMNNSCEAISSYDQGTKYFCPYNCPAAGINCCSPKQNGIEDNVCNTCLKEHGCNI